MQGRQIKGAKYYVTAGVDKSATTFFVDSGADVSILPRRCAPHAPLVKLQRPVTIGGFTRSTDPIIVTHKIDVILNFHPGKVKASFYVCDTKVPIIGSDLLRNKELKLSLHTGKEIVTIRQHVINTKASPAESRGEYIRRCEKGEIAYAREMSNTLQTTSWMRASEEMILPPDSMTLVKAYIDAPFEPSDSQFPLAI